MAADRRKEESLLPPDYVSLAQLQKQWLQAQEEKKQKQEVEDRNKVAPAPIGYPPESGRGIEGKEDTSPGKRDKAQRVELMVVKDMGGVKVGGEFGKDEGVDIMAREKRKTKSEKEGQQSKVLEKVNEGCGDGGKGISRNSTNEPQGSPENKRIASASRRGYVRKGDIRGWGQENSVKLNESERKKTVENEHGERRGGSGAKPWKHRLRKGSRPANIKIKEVDPEMGDEVVEVCNAISCLTTSDEIGISEPKGYQIHNTEADNADANNVIGENVTLEKDKLVETKGPTKNDRKRRVGRWKAVNFSAENEDKHPELVSGNYHEKVSFASGRSRYWNQNAYRRSSSGAHAALGRFERGLNGKVGNSRMVWMRKGDKPSTDAAEQGSSGDLEGQN